MQTTGYDSNSLSYNLNELEDQIPSNEMAYSSVQALMRANQEIDMVFSDISSVNLFTSSLPVMDTVNRAILIK